jgi:hypothetical protein
MVSARLMRKLARVRVLVVEVVLEGAVLVMRGVGLCMQVAVAWGVGEEEEEEKRG